MIDLEKQPNETDLEYKIRICELCESRNLTWQQGTDILNNFFNTSYGESKFRKHYKAWKAGYEYALNTNYDNHIKESIDEIKLEKIKIRDERLELNRLYRNVARSENILQIIKDNVSSFRSNKIMKLSNDVAACSTDLIVCLSDLHIGSYIDSDINFYNEDELKSRMEFYLNRIKEIYTRHNSKDIYLVMLGDIINGHIHLNSRLSNNESTIKQIITASEIISNFAEQLSTFCDNLNIYYINGNHGRLFPGKEDNTSNDNLELIIEFYLSQALKDINNVKVVTDKISNSFGLFKVRNSNVAYIHGDKDDPKTVVHKLTMFTKIPIDIVLMGHRHKNEMISECGSKVIQSGCMCGPDEYAINLRLSDPPQQAVAVISDDGLDCVYDVKINNNKKITI